MLAIRELRKVAWHAPRAGDRYVGYLALTDEAVRLSGRDESTCLDVAISIPHAAPRSIRASKGTVIELVDGEIVVTPVDGSTQKSSGSLTGWPLRSRRPAAGRRVSRRR